MAKKIYTHDEAMLIVEAFEEVLSRYDISVPSPEDYEREPDNMVGLYGSTYSDLLDYVEDSLVALLDKHKDGAEIIVGEFYGTV